MASVNHSGDSDSTGSVTGNIIGAILGYNAIPSYYKENLELLRLIEEIATDLSTDILPSKSILNNTPEGLKLLKKYCHYKKSLFN